jgi:hypothetical protein
MAGESKPLPACQEYDLGNVGFVKLMPDGTAHFWLGDADPLDHGSVITSEHLPIMRKIVKHLERGGF